jgi:hypothetical protein
MAMTPSDARYTEKKHTGRSQQMMHRVNQNMRRDKTRKRATTARVMIRRMEASTAAASQKQKRLIR